MSMPRQRPGAVAAEGRTIEHVSHYDVLGAASDADAEQLRRAFVAQARRYHPDRHIGAEPAVRREAERRMRQITEAWAVLGDPERRRRYDLGMSDSVARRGAATPSAPRPAPAGSAAGSAGRPVGGSRRPGVDGSGPAAGPRRTGSASTVGPSGGGAAEPRSWRSYASPGPGGGRSRPMGEQLLLLSPVLFLFVAGLLGMGGAVIGWPPFYGMALVCLVAAAAAFFMLPIWAMTRRTGRPGRGVKGPKRSY